MTPCLCSRCSEPLTSDDLALNGPGEESPRCEFCLFEGAEDDDERDYSDPMDGDHESALASAGFGTDEDYGCFSYDK